MPKTTAPGGGPQKRRRYTKEFKEEVVQMLRAAAPTSAYARPN